MSAVQRQDLVVFNDHSVVSDQIFQNGFYHLITITASPFTSPTWLINSLVESQILGRPYSLNADSSAAQGHSRPVTVGSFVHEPQLFHNALGRLKVAPQKYKVVDLVTDLVVKSLGKPRSKVYSDILQQFPLQNQSVIVLEQPELLLSLLEGSTSDEIHSQLITPLMKRCSVLILTTSVYDDSEDATRDSLEFSRFTLNCIYKSIVVMSLRPLETGRANDVTGTLRITRGGVRSPVHVVENEYLYLNQKETTRLFYR
ncbi:hypothetical protein ZYGR_0I00480 [Zygosaccharomyces rouxii]|uniref:Elongator complex protein 6 n=1 Tax=Zygosaccharomyces rouxii TaxID=4956 RepID=A0A1Q2ZW65_ZYGRO|nr:hypothetical protein ZYGR_0I00480 [Zygosaccharomyces rouxii]